jgi:hypothetical protein
MVEAPHKMAAAIFILLRRLARALLAIPVVLYFLLADLIVWAIAPALDLLAKLAFWRRMEALIAALPAYGALIVLAVPVVLLEPPKALALWWMATGSFWAGLALLLAAKIFEFVVIVRLHAIATPKLLSIAWYAWLHHAVLALRAHLYAALATLPYALDALRLARELTRRARTWLAFVWRRRPRSE